MKNMARIVSRSDMGIATPMIRVLLILLRKRKENYHDKDNPVHQGLINCVYRRFNNTGGVNNHLETDSGRQFRVDLSDSCLEPVCNLHGVGVTLL